jgi:hypothetical protein
MVDAKLDTGRAEHTSKTQDATKAKGEAATKMKWEADAGTRADEAAGQVKIAKVSLLRLARV